MTQSAVEFLLKWINDNLSESLIPIHVKEQAKEMEKKQIIDAWIATDNELQRMAAEQYYTSTYGSKGSDDQVPDVRKMVDKQAKNNNNPNNVKIGEWVILDDNEEHLVRIFSMTELQLFSEVGSHSSPIDTWEVMTNRLKQRQ